MIIKIKKLHKNAIIPKYIKMGDAGFDFFACENCNVYPYKERSEIYGIKTGLAFEIPFGYEMNIRARSGLSLKYPNYIVITGGGTVDPGYRGEIIVFIINNNRNTWRINKGDRIAQGILHSVEQCTFEKVDELSVTERNIGGFGSTGK